MKFNAYIAASILAYPLGMAAALVQASSPTKIS